MRPELETRWVLFIDSPRSWRQKDVVARPPRP